MEAIDAAAMRIGDTNSEEYLDGWTSSESMPIEGDAQQCVDQVAADLEAQYSRQRLLALIKSGGWES
jgi:hypothetical protein